MRISDWSSDVCSSDLRRPRAAPRRGRRPRQRAALRPGAAGLIPPEWRRNGAVRRPVFRPALHKQGRRTTEDAMALRHAPQRVSAAEFIRGFAGWRLQAARAPVVVTTHGTDAHVMISPAAYPRLHGRTTEGARHPTTSSPAALSD